MVRIKVYISSVIPSVLDIADPLTLGHACDSPGAIISSSLRNMPKGSSGIVSDEERKAVDLVERYSEENGLDYEIIDLTKVGKMTQLKFILKGWKAPVIRIGNETIVGLPTKEQLESTLRRHDNVAVSIGEPR